MGYINKAVSVKEVLLKVERTFRPQGTSWLKDCIEDVGWAIQGIGYHTGFISKSTSYPYITIKNNRALIPCDVQRIKFVEQLLPMPGNNAEILNPDGTTPGVVDTLNGNNNNGQIVDPELGINTDNVHNQIVSASTQFRSVRLRLGSDISLSGIDDESPRTTRVLPNAPYYDVNGDYIITSFNCGLIKLNYVGFDLDTKGYPKVIDDFDYKTAVEWYLAYGMMLRGYKHPLVDHKEAFQMWETYRLRAENACKVMSLDGADKFKNSWSRYVQNNEVSKDFFINNEQTVYINRG